MSTPCLILARHGETKLNSQVAGESAERIRGWKDVPLDKAGIASANKIASHLKAEHIGRIDRLYSSPLSRAMATAEPIGKLFRVIPSPVKALLPWHVGDFAGKLARDVIPRMNELVDNEDVSAPGGEPFARFRERTLRFVSNEIRRARVAKQIAVLVTHTRDVQLVRAWIAGGSKADLSIDVDAMGDYSNEIPPGGYLKLHL